MDASVLSSGASPSAPPVKKSTAPQVTWRRLKDHLESSALKIESITNAVSTGNTSHRVSTTAGSSSTRHRAVSSTCSFPGKGGGSLGGAVSPPESTLSSCGDVTPTAARSSSLAGQMLATLKKKRSVVAIDEDATSVCSPSARRASSINSGTRDELNAYALLRRSSTAARERDLAAVIEEMAVLLSVIGRIRDGSIALSELRAEDSCLLPTATSDHVLLAGEATCRPPLEAFAAYEIPVSPEEMMSRLQGGGVRTMAVLLRRETDTAVTVDQAFQEIATGLVSVASTALQAHRCHGNAVHCVVPSSNAVVTLWRSRRTGKSYHRSLCAVAAAVRSALLPSFFRSIPCICVAWQGQLFTVTFAPPISSTPVLRPQPLMYTSSAMVTAAASLVVTALLGHHDDSAGPPLQDVLHVYSCSDSSYVMLPNYALLQHMAERRVELALYCHLTSSTPMERLKATLLRMVTRESPLVFTATLNRSPTEKVVFWSRLLHFHGVKLQELLRVRYYISCIFPGGERQPKHDDNDDDDAGPMAEMKKLLSSMILNEVVARVLKGMALSQANFSFAAFALLGRSMSAAEVADALTTVFQKFLKSSKFVKESLLPAMAKRFPCEKDTTFEVSDLNVLDVAMFLKHRLGLDFMALSKRFVVHKTALAPQETANGPSTPALSIHSSSSSATASVSQVVDAHPLVLGYSHREAVTSLAVLQFAELSQMLAGAAHAAGSQLSPSEMSSALAIAVFYSGCCAFVKLPATAACFTLALQLSPLRGRPVNVLVIHMIQQLRKYCGCKTQHDTPSHASNLPQQPMPGDERLLRMCPVVPINGVVLCVADMCWVNRLMTEHCRADAGLADVIGAANCDAHMPSTLAIAGDAKRTKRKGKAPHQAAHCQTAEKKSGEPPTPSERQLYLYWAQAVMYAQGVELLPPLPDPIRTLSAEHAVLGDILGDKKDNHCSNVVQVSNSPCTPTFSLTQLCADAFLRFSLSRSRWWCTLQELLLVAHARTLDDSGVAARENVAYFITSLACFWKSVVDAGKQSSVSVQRFHLAEVEVDGDIVTAADLKSLCADVFSLLCWGGVTYASSPTMLLQRSPDFWPEFLQFAAEACAEPTPAGNRDGLSAVNEPLRSAASDPRRWLAALVVSDLEDALRNRTQPQFAKRCCVNGLYAFFAQWSFEHVISRVAEEPMTAHQKVFGAMRQAWSDALRRDSVFATSFIERREQEAKHAARRRSTAAVVSQPADPAMVASPGSFHTIPQWALSIYASMSSALDEYHAVHVAAHPVEQLRNCQRKVPAWQEVYALRLQLPIIEPASSRSNEGAEEKFLCLECASAAKKRASEIRAKIAELTKPKKETTLVKKDGAEMAAEMAAEGAPPAEEDDEVENDDDESNNDILENTGDNDVNDVNEANALAPEAAALLPTISIDLGVGATETSSEPGDDDISDDVKIHSTETADMQDAMITTATHAQQKDKAEVDGNANRRNDMFIKRTPSHPELSTSHTSPKRRSGPTTPIQAPKVKPHGAAPFSRFPSLQSSPRHQAAPRQSSRTAAAFLPFAGKVETAEEAMFGRRSLTARSAPPGKHKHLAPLPSIPAGLRMYAASQKKMLLHSEEHVLLHRRIRDLETRVRNSIYVNVDHHDSFVLQRAPSPPTSSNSDAADSTSGALPPMGTATKCHKSVLPCAPTQSAASASFSRRGVVHTRVGGQPPAVKAPMVSHQRSEALRSLRLRSIVNEEQTLRRRVLEEEGIDVFLLRMSAVGLARRGKEASKPHHLHAVSHRGSSFAKK